MNKTTVIVPTIDRPQQLSAMLDSLLAQTVLPTEIIIVDQSPNDEPASITRGMLEEHNKRENQKIVLKYVHNTQITGTSQARNIGIGVSEGDIIFFFDDDVILTKNYIEEILKVYKGYPEVVGVGGVITNYGYLNALRIRLFNNIFFLGIFHDERRKIFVNYKKYTKPIKVSKLSGCAVSYKKHSLGCIRFDEHFTGYSFGEDIDLSLRLRRSKMLITPWAQLEHKSKSLLGERSTSCRYLFWEVSSWTYIHMKNSSFFQHIFFLWLCVGWLLRAVLGLLKGKKTMCESVIAGYQEGIARYKQWKEEDAKLNKNFL